MRRRSLQGGKRARGRGEAAKLTAAGNLLLRYAERMLVLATDAMIATKDLQARPLCARVPVFFPLQALLGLFWLGVLLPGWSCSFRWVPCKMSYLT